MSIHGVLLIGKVHISLTLELTFSRTLKKPSQINSGCPRLESHLDPHISYIPHMGHPHIFPLCWSLLCCSLPQLHWALLSAPTTGWPKSMFWLSGCSQWHQVSMIAWRDVVPKRLRRKYHWLWVIFLSVGAGGSWVSHQGFPKGQQGRERTSTRASFSHACLSSVQFISIARLCLAFGL